VGYVWEWEGGEEKRGNNTHSNPSGDKVDLVKDVDKVLVSLLLAEVIDNGPAARTERVTGVEDVDNNIRRVEDLVELSPNTTRGTLVVGGLGLSHTDGVESLLGGLLLRLVSVALDDRRLAKLSHRADVETGTLALGLGTKGVGERFGLDNVDTLVGGLVLVRKQAHGELVALEQNRVRVRLVLREGGTEVVERSLRDDTGVAEPAAIGLDATRESLLLALLESGRLDDLAVAVTNGLSAVQHLQARRRLRISVKRLASLLA
jgi:hypothetical protein